MDMPIRVPILMAARSIAILHLTAYCLEARWYAIHLRGWVTTTAMITMIIGVLPTHPAPAAGAKGRAVVLANPTQVLAPAAEAVDKANPKLVPAAVAVVAKANPPTQAPAVKVAGTRVKAAPAAAAAKKAAGTRKRKNPDSRFHAPDV